MKRVFCIGTLTDITDPNPLGSLQDSFEALCHIYPTIRHSTIFESDAEVVDAETLRYRIPLIATKTNG